jgi:hypothetical protein
MGVLRDFFETRCGAVIGFGARAYSITRLMAWRYGKYGSGGEDGLRIYVEITNGVLTVLGWARILIRLFVSLSAGQEGLAL